MVTNKTEALQLMSVLLRFLSKEEAYKLVSEMELMVESSENESLKASLLMVRRMLGYEYE
jgi:hypothetical protein